MGENKMEGKVRIWGSDCKSDRGTWKETKTENDMKMSIFTGKAWTN
jgi:hypothetical protein